MATAIQFLRSSTPNLRPNPVTLEDGMPMLNYNPADPGLYFALEDDTLLKVGPTHVGTIAPNSGAQGFAGYAVGEQWLDTSAGNTLKTWDGTSWLSGSFALSGDSLIDDGVGIRLNENSTDFATFPRNASGDGYNLSGNIAFGTNSATHRVSINGGLRLLDQNTYPTGSLGALATVGGSLVYHNGSSWQLVVTPSGTVGVQSVNSQVGIVSLDADDISDATTINKYVTSAEKALISTATQPGDNVSVLTNDAGYITSSTAPVQQIIAGTNVSISPTSGLGAVTINTDSSSVSISSTAPSNPTEGNLWWDDTDGRPYIWYDDSGSQQWVPFAPGVSNSNYTYPGGVQQTLQARLEQYVSVLDFGAVGDGVTDDTSAIQDALDTQRSIYLPKGNYKISSPLKTTTNGQHITGENRNQTYLRGVPNQDYDLLRVLHSQVDVSGILFRPGTDGDPTASPASWACVRITSSWAHIHDNRFLSDSDGDSVAIFLDDVNPETSATVAGAYIHTIQNNLIGYSGYAFKVCVYSLCSTNGQQATKFLNNYLFANIGFQILKGGGNQYANNLLQSATGTYTTGVGNGFDFSVNVSGETVYGNYIERFDKGVILRATDDTAGTWRGDYFGNHFDNNNDNVVSLGTKLFSSWDYVERTQLVNGTTFEYNDDGYDINRSDGVTALAVNVTRSSVEPRKLIFSDHPNITYTANSQSQTPNTVYGRISGDGQARTGCSLGGGIEEGQLLILYGNSWAVQILNTNAIFNSGETSVTFGNAAGQIVAMQLIWNGSKWVELSRTSV